MTLKEIHSDFPPSKMELFLACPGAHALERTMPNRYSNFSDEGRAAHALAEKTLKDGVFNTRAYLGEKIVLTSNLGTPFAKTSVFTVDEEMCKNVQAYVDAVTARMKRYKADKTVKNVTLFVEKKIDTSPVAEQPQYGHADAALLVEYKDGTGLISIEDLKYGQGVPVVAKDNTQLMLYAAGAVRMFQKQTDIKKATLVIHMPRLNYISEWDVSLEQLQARTSKVRRAIAKALEQERIFEKKGIGGLTLKPGKSQCRFCRAKSICPAFNAFSKKNKPVNDKTAPVKIQPRKPDIKKRP